MKFTYPLLITISLTCIIFPLSVVTHEFGHAITGLSLGLKNVHVIVWPGWQLYPKFDRSRQNDWPKSAIAMTRFGSPVQLGLDNPPKSVWPSLQSAPKLGDTNQNYWPKRNIALTDFDHKNLNLKFEDSLAYQIQDMQLNSASPEIPPVPDTTKNALILLMGSGLNWLLSLLTLFLLVTFKNNRFVLITCMPIAFLYYDLVTYTLLPALFGLKHFVFWGGSESEPLIGLITLGVNKQFAIIAISCIALAQTMVTIKALRKRNVG